MSKAAATRLTILQKAFELIYVNGYQSTSIDDIIATTQVTKGAFYYHFKNKEEMGLAVINEVMSPSMDMVSEKISNASDPVEDLYGMLEYLLFEDPFLQVKYGCPAGNLTQEMSPLNTEFSVALARLVTKWQEAVRLNIRNGQEAGNIRKDVNAEQVGYFIMSGYWGIRNFGKLYNSSECYKSYLKEIKLYLQSLQ